MEILVLLILLLCLSTIIILNTHVLHIEKIKLKTQYAKGMRYIQISDIHDKLGFLNGNLVNRINLMKPDFVVGTGDYSNSQRKLPSLLEELSKIDCDVYMILGNYERQEVQGLFFKKEIDIQIIENEIAKYKNLHLLINREKKIKINGFNVSLYGFDNSTYGNEIYNSIEKKDELEYKILLSHSPNIIGLINHKKIEYNHLMVGHTHGKQIDLAINRTAYDDFHKGTKKVSENKYFTINSGLGTVRLPIRFKSLPTMSLFET